MHRGYVKYWRKSIDHALFKKPLLWHFWQYCLIKASRNERDVFINGIMVSIPAGSFVFGRKVASIETGLSEQQIRTALKHFEKLENLTIKTTNKYSIISIINWDVYQEHQPADQPTDQPIINQQSTTDKKVEKGRRDMSCPTDPKKTESIYPENFLAFWSLYPKKTGKGAAYKAYLAIKGQRPSLSTITKALEWQCRSEQWQDARYIPNPATWLNQRRWDDEPTETKTTTAAMTPDEIRREYGLC